MLITDKNTLKKFGTNHRFWQGIPGLEKTKGGRLFACFYSGNHCEDRDNCCLLVKSDDDGKTWSEPIAAAYRSKLFRCYDPCLWIDPLGRLWFIWALAPNRAVYAAVCDEPDAEELVFSPERIIGHDVCMNKPTVLSNGKWLFPITVWDRELRFPRIQDSESNEVGAFVYESADNGKTFTKLGHPENDAHSYDEHMTVELKDGRVMMLIRTRRGIQKAFSNDGGRTWTRAIDFDLPAPDSRFFIRRLRSGNLLLVSHYEFTGRNNLTAFLSEDDGQSWPYRLLLDERDMVSYPDGTEDENGYLYIAYDRERGDRASYEESRKNAREILFAKFTENDIKNGALCDSGSRLKGIVSKLGDYDGDTVAPYNTKKYCGKNDISEILAQVSDSKALENMLKLYFHANIDALQKEETLAAEWDLLLGKLRQTESIDTDVLEQILTLLSRV